MKKRCFFLNTKPLYETIHSLQICLKITQTSVTFFVKVTTAEELREDLARNNQKRTKTVTETTKVKYLPNFFITAKQDKTLVTKKEKPHYNKTHDCRWQTKAIATVFRDMSQEKKDIVKKMGFGVLAHVPEMNVSHALLRELIDCYDDTKGCLKTLQEKIYITPRKVAAALGINNGENCFDENVDYTKLNLEDKAIFDSVKNISLATLTRNVLDMSIEGEENWQKFKRTFVVFIQKRFLLPTTISVASSIHKLSIFHVDNIWEWDWTKHVLNFLIKGIENKRKGTKQFVNDYVFVLMLIYFPC
ncbi:hypothetical protein Ahy_A01g000066 [Arachis hypogaea]|uniref:Uncharacterized protein n=1 Tax=Arachis hypogaea TaxID=3818 RepID=A0A445EJC9_ARAHY|nr:hypothetical protein Ahy_A01g000066 [Arachis hypogaea]